MSDDKLGIWNLVEKTNPADTKAVDYGRKFTAIDAYSQIRKATELFGPVGTGWGYDVELSTVEGVCIARVTLWYEKKTQVVIAFGSNKWSNKSGVDMDTPKKALTDGITKALSYLGFNADVFLGKFDDNKYVQEMNAEFGGKKTDKKAVAKKAKPPKDEGKAPDHRATFIAAIEKRCAEQSLSFANLSTFVKKHIFEELVHLPESQMAQVDTGYMQPSNTMTAKSTGFLVLADIVKNYNVEDASLRGREAEIKSKKGN